MYHHPTAYTAGFVRAFGAKPDSPRRASGEGLDGSDPHFLTAGAVSRGGGCTTRCTTGCTIPPPLRGGRSRRMYPCRKAPRPTRAPADQPVRGARCVTHSSAPFLSSAASVPWPRGRGRACSPRPIPWPCSSATTRRTCTPPSSLGTTSRRAWPCSSSANSLSARRGSGSPRWASGWGSGRAFPRGRFRRRRTARRLSSGRSIRIGYGVGVLEQGRLNLQIGVDAERRESSLVQMQEQGVGTDQRVLGRATVQW